MSFARRRKKMLTLAVSSASPSQFITDDGQFQEGDIQISKSGMSISSPTVTTRPESIIQGEEDLKLDDIEVLEEVGRGAGGSVKKVRHKISKRLMALKIVPLDVTEEIRKRIILELKTLYQSQSPYIVNFYGAFFTEGHIQICLEYMDAGSLHHLLHLAGTFPEPVIGFVSVQVLKGLVYLHKERHLLHRDIKPSNILINTKGEVKISDFGVSGQLATSISSCVSWVGTVTYMSPERIQGKSYSTQSDIWSLGLSIFEMALGRFPYLEPGQKAQVNQEGLGFWELLDKIVQKDVPQLPSGSYSPELSSFIGACLTKNSIERPSAQALLEHPFIKRYEASNFDVSGWVKQFITPEPEADIAPPERKLRSSRSTEFSLRRSDSGEEVEKKMDDLSLKMMKKLF